MGRTTTLYAPMAGDLAGPVEAPQPGNRTKGACDRAINLVQQRFHGSATIFFAATTVPFTPSLAERVRARLFLRRPRTSKYAGVPMGKVMQAYTEVRAQERRIVIETAFFAARDFTTLWELIALADYVLLCALGGETFDHISSICESVRRPRVEEMARRIFAAFGIDTPLVVETFDPDVSLMERTGWVGYEIAARWWNRRVLTKVLFSR